LPVIFDEDGRVLIDEDGNAITTYDINDLSPGAGGEQAARTASRPSPWVAFGQP
jgi:hypothetical protein